MTAYVIRLRVSGTYLDILPKGIVRHVDLDRARQFEFATSALVAANHLEIHPSEFDVVPVEAGS